MNFEFMTIDTPLPPCMPFPRALTGFPVSSTAKVMYCRMLDAMIYATALDYDRTAKTTKQFFAKVQNKMHYAVHGHTAAELIYERADADKPHMGLTTWAAAPEGKIVKSDVSIAKNYLTDKEMRSLERIVSAYLDLAMERCRHQP